MFIYYFILSLSFLAALEGCSSHSALPPRDLKGPTVKVQRHKLESNIREACLKITSLQVSPRHYQQAAYDAGILADDFVSLKKTADAQNVIISIRDVNKSCAPHLQAGYPSKGHDVLSKTFTAESLPPEYQYLAGTVSTLMKKPKAGEKITDPLSKRHLAKDGNILTCDYDLMDVAEADGQRVPGESERDLQVRQKLNQNLPWRGQPPHPVKRIMHGAQAEYLYYLYTAVLKDRPEKPIFELLKPESPLTAFTHKGDVYRLHELEDVLNFYRCYHIALPPEWNLQ